MAEPTPQPAGQDEAGNNVDQVASLVGAAALQWKRRVEQARAKQKFLGGSQELVPGARRRRSLQERRRSSVGGGRSSGDDGGLGSDTDGKVPDQLIAEVHEARLGMTRRRRSSLLSSVHTVSDRALGVYDQRRHSLAKEPRKELACANMCKCPRFRAPFARVVRNKWFDRFIVLIIFINCLFLAAVDPLDTNPNSPLNTVLDTADLVFQIIYTIEMFFKCAAFGVFCGPRAYVKQTWNIIDGSLVLAGWFGYLPFFQGASLSSIRIVRMLRPLRTVQVVPGLKLLVNSMLASLPQLGNVLFLCLFLFLLFGITGVQLFGGLMDARCVVPTPTSPVASFVIPDEETTALCNLGGGDRQCMPTAEGNQTECARSGLRPNQDITHFDNIFVAFLSIFQCITMEGWVDVMYWVEETGLKWTSFLYFTLLIAMGAIFLLNLIVAVIVTTLSVENDIAWEAQLEQEEEEQQRNGELDDDAFPPPDRPRRRRRSSVAAVAALAIKRRRESKAVDEEAGATVAPDPTDQDDPSRQIESNRFDIAPVVTTVRRHSSDAAGSVFHDLDPVLRTPDANALATAGDGATSSAFAQVATPDAARRRALAASTVTPVASFSPPSDRGDTPPPARLAQASGEGTGEPGTMSQAAGEGGGRVAAPRSPGGDAVSAMVNLAEQAERVNSGAGRGELHDAPTPVPGGVALDELVRSSPADSPFDRSADTPGAVNTSSRQASPQRVPRRSSHSAAQDSKQQPSVAAKEPLPTLEGSFAARLPSLRVTPKYKQPLPPARSPGQEEVAGNGGDGRGSPLPGQPGTGAEASARRADATSPGPPRTLDFGRQGPTSPAIYAKQRQGEATPTSPLPKDGPAHDMSHRSLSLPKVTSRKENVVVDIPANRMLDFVEVADEGQVSQLPATPMAVSSRRLVDTMKFRIFIIVLILVNTVLLALEHHGMSAVMKDVLDAFNLVLTIVFALEMILKLVAYGCRGYWRDSFNTFDGIIVIVSLVEILLVKLAGIEAGGGVSALRALRLLRVLKLARSWESLNEIISAMGSSLVKIAPFSIILALFMFIYSLLGMQLFGGKLGSPAPRLNFDSLLWSFVTTFQILTGENWNEAMYLCVTQVGWAATVYFVSEVVIGTYVVLNLFLAILIDHFTELSEQRDITKMEALAEAGALQDMAIDSALPIGGSGLQDGAVSAPSVHTLAGMRGARPTGRRTSNAASATSFEPLTQQSGRPASQASGGSRNSRASPALDEKQTAPTGRRPAFGESARTVQLPPAAKPGGRSIAGESTGGNAWRTTHVSRQNTDSPWRRAVTHASQDSVGPASSGKIPLSPKQLDARQASERRRQMAMQSRRVLAATKSKAQMERENRITAYKSMAKLRRRRVSRKCCGYRCDRFPQHASYANKACSVFAHTNRVRYFVADMVLHPVFEAVITLLIFVACTALAMDSVEASSGLVKGLKVTNLVLTVLFAMEMFLKMFAFGVARGPGAYMRDPWNLLDMFIVIISIVDLGLDGTLQFIKVLRFLRALRPLRAVKRLKGLRVVINAVIRAFPGAMNVALVCLLFFFLYGILGVNFFAGTFYSCTDASRVCEPGLVGAKCPESMACNGTWVPEGSVTAVPREWVNAAFVDGRGTYSFDNSLVALMTLFEVASLELWHEVMYSAVDVVGVGWAPERNANEIAAFFFIAFIMFGSMFMLNLFVSVVVDNFRKMKQAEAGGSLFMTEAQQQWVEMRTIIARMRPAPLAAPPETSSGFRAAAFRIVAHPYFDFSIMACIVANVLVMCTQHADQEWAWETVGNVSNLVFGAIFLLEMIVKHIGLGVRQYWSSSWNCFDGALVILNVATVLMREVAGEELGLDITLFRVVRVFRIFRLVKTVPQLRLIFTTLMLSLPSMANVGTLLLLLFFMYAVMGMSLFGNAEFSTYLNEHANFRNFGRAFLVLIRMATGESWNGIMHDVMKPDDLVSELAAYLYFSSFVVLGQFMMINLFVAVILENFEREFSSDTTSKVTSADLEYFADLWASMPRTGKLRRDAKHLDMRHFKMFLFRLGIPLGFDPVLDCPTYRMEFIAMVNVHVHTRHGGIQCVEYNNVLEQLVKRVLAAGDGGAAEDLEVPISVDDSDGESGSPSLGGNKSQASLWFSNASRKLNIAAATEQPSLDYKTVAAAIVVQRMFRRRRLRAVAGVAKLAAAMGRHIGHNTRQPEVASDDDGSGRSGPRASP